MSDRNMQAILSKIKEGDIVLDIGGWFKPFSRANWVIDAMPYETRSGACSIEQKKKEYFTKDSWIQRDLCKRIPLPFREKEIDFVVCSHTLEDVRDPVFLCSEICRVGKRGYIEAPSKIVELCLGVEERGYAGYSHHRWLIEIKETRIDFVAKPHFIHSKWKFHLPVSYLHRIKPQEHSQWLFWEEEFDFDERLVIGAGILESEIEKFIRAQGAYPDFFYRIDDIKDSLKSLCKR